MTNEAEMETHIQNWLESLHVTRILAHEFKFDQPIKDEPSGEPIDTTLEVLTHLSDSTIDAILEEGCKKIKDRVHQGRQHLRKCLEKQRETLKVQKETGEYLKFCEDLNAISSGSVEDFHDGLLGRVGEDANSSFCGGQLLNEHLNV